jgi:alkylation response protein AidB-like acyl-CoA dehydrogenase
VPVELHKEIPEGLVIQDYREPSFEELFPSLLFFKKGRKREFEEVKTYHARVREFRKKYVDPYLLEMERQVHKDPRYLPKDLLRAACQMNLFTCLIPKSLGGRGVPLWAIPIITEELAAGCVGVANLIFVNGLMIASLASSFDFSKLSLVARKLVDMEMRGEPPFLATAVTEPSAGSDTEDVYEFKTARVSTRIKRVEGGYEISGTKVFISNGSVARFILMDVLVDQKNPQRGLRCFLLTPDMKGFSVGKIEKKMGTQLSPTAELVLDQCFVPDQNVIESQVSSSDHLGLTLAVSRGWVGAVGAGAARRAFEVAWKYSLKTRLGGQRFIDNQWVQLELAQMYRNAALARTLALEAFLANEAWGLIRVFNRLRLPGERFFLRTGLWKIIVGVLSRVKFLGSLLGSWISRNRERERTNFVTLLGDGAKISGSSLAVENARRALLLMGADGVRRENEIEKIYRDAKLLQIYDGTNQACGIDLFERLANPGGIS